MRIFVILAVLLLGGVAAGAGFLWSGLYNIAADDEHTAPVFLGLTTLRERSVEVRVQGVKVPPLDDAALIRSGAGNYAAMCAGCHLAPGEGESELSKGLYPRPPRLADAARKPEAAHDFWVIKHGIKASGMAAWGKSMEDPYIWGLTAFLQKLPTLSAEQYETLVESSEGHSHGGGEDHHHEAGAEPEHEAAPAGESHHHHHGKAAHQH